MNSPLQQRIGTIPSQICSHPTRIAPVHKLPNETLTDIFRLVAVNCCHNPLFTGGGAPANPIRYPDCLAHVCSRWRQIALSFPCLWTHVDLIPHPSIGEGFIHRAHSYTKRASKLPLDIHLDDKGCMSKDCYIIGGVLSRLSSRSKSMNFVMTAPELLHFHRSVFDSILPMLSPKIFKTLCMTCEVSLPNPFIAGRDSDPWRIHDPDEYNWGPNILNCGSEVIDRSLSGVTNLHLQGVFFNWSRKLYHGLADLRLTSPPIGKAVDIDVYALLSILSNCPGLRIFHFSLELVTYDDPEYELLYKGPSGPVALLDLEVVYVSTARAYYGAHHSFHAGSLLRLLAPGSKPLRLTLETGRDRNEPLFNSDGMREFCARSKVEKLCIKSGYPSLDDLRFCHLPDLKVLVLDSCHHISVHANPSSPFRIHSCFIHAARFHSEKLRSIVELCPTGLVLSMCEIRDRPTCQEENRAISEAELRATFPTVQFLVDESLWSDPAVDWDVVD